MRNLLLALFAAGSCLAFAHASTSDRGGSLPTNDFAREPIILFTEDVLTPTGFESRTLTVYQDGYATASRSGDGTNAPVVRSGNISVPKARSWYGYLLTLGAGSLPDGASPAPGEASTLTIIEPVTNALTHTFSYGPGDYPDIERAIEAMFLRLNV